MNSFLKHRIFKVGFLLLFLTNNSAAINISTNVSQSFNSSLAFQNTGNFVWSLWDYLTNPYLYSLNQRNSLSLMFTNLDNFLAGGSVLIFDFPVFLAMELGNLNASKTQQIFPDRESRIQSNADQYLSQGNTLDINFMLGSVVFDGYGLGVYVNYSDKRTEISDITVLDGRFISDRESSDQLDRDNSSDLSLGCEFGKYIKDAHSFSFSAAIGYRSYGNESNKDFLQLEDGSRGDILGENDAPALELGRGTPAWTRLFTSTFFGAKKREAFLSFLGWYTVSSLLNTGMYMEFFHQPRLEGTDSSIGTVNVYFKRQESVLTDFLSRNNQGSRVGVESTKINVNPFTDINFKTFIGTLRFTPDIKYSYHQESAQFDFLLNDGSIRNDETSLDIGLSFKLQIYLNPSKTIILLAAWRPRLNLHYILNQTISNIQVPEEVDGETITGNGISIFEPEDDIPDNEDYKYRLSRGILSDNGTLSNISLGLMYRVSENLVLHIGFLHGTGRFQIDEIDFGLDYYF